MKLIENTIWIEWQEAIGSGVSKSTLDLAKFRASDSFRFMDDPTDARKVLIHFDTMKPQYQALIRAKYGEPRVYLANTIIEQHLTADQKAFDFFTNHTLADGTGLPHKHISAYCTAAAWLNLLNSSKEICKKLGLTKSEFFTAAIALIKQRGIELPTNYSNLMSKLREYNEGGYAVLISKKFGNKNTEKLTEDGKQWLIAQYATPLKLNCDTAALTLQYRQEAAQRGWTPVSEQCVYKFLHQPDVESLWYLGRHGWKKWRLRFEHKNKIVPPSFRDALWEGDGTKLNFFTSGLRAQLNMYFVVDVHSEMILGCDISTGTEDFNVQQRAFRAAVKTAQHKPYQILYDNQGGHKGGAAQSFFDKIARVHFPAKPYNSESKHIERIIGRFQKQVMSQYWFFTGMNVTTKANDSSVNKEFYSEHMKELPSVPEIIRIAYACVDQWNQMKHPRFDKTRSEVYYGSENPEPQPLGLFDEAELFYTTTGEITYYPGGITVTVGKEKRTYEALTESGVPDLTHIRAKYVVKYDEQDLSQVLLYRKDASGDLRFVCVAPEKDGVPRAVADYREGDRERIDEMMKLRKQQLQMTEDALADVREASGWSVDDVLRAGELAPKDMALKAQSIYLSAEDDEEIKPIEN